VSVFKKVVSVLPNNSPLIVKFLVVYDLNTAKLKYVIKHRGLNNSWSTCTVIFETLSQCRFAWRV